MAERVAETVLRYKTDTASVAAAAQANQSVAASFASVADAAKQLGLSAEQVTQLNAQLGTTAAAQTQELTKQSYLADRLTQAALARQSAEQGTLATLRQEAFTGAAAGNAGLVGGLRGAQQAAIALPGVGFQSPIVLGLRGLAIVAEKTGASVGQLTAGVGIAGAAVIAVAVAFDRFNLELEGSKKALNAALNANKEYYQALGSLTSQEVEQQIADLRRARPILEQERNQLQEQVTSAFRQAQQTALGDPGARILFNQLPTGELKTAFDEADKSLQENIRLETQLTQGRNAGAFAANDARRAEEQLAEIRRKNSEQVTELVGGQLFQQGQDIANFQSLTREERIKQADELRVTIGSQRQYKEQLEATRETLDPTTATYAAYTSAINQTEAEITRLVIRQTELGRVFLTLADIIVGVEEKAKQLQDQFDLYGAAIEDEGKISEKLVALEKDLADARADAHEKLADIVIKGEERRSEIAADAGEKRAEIEQNTQDAIAKIMRDTGREQHSAVAFRDALAFTQAQQKAADALADQQKQEEKQLTQQDKAQAKQLAALQKSEDEQIRNTLRALDKETRVKQDAIFMQEQALFKAQYDSAQIAQYGSNNQIAIQSNMWSQMDMIANNGALQLVRSFANAVYGGATGLIGALTPASYTGGGLPPVTGTAALNSAIDARIAQTINPNARPQRGY